MKALCKGLGIAVLMASLTMPGTGIAQSNDGNNRRVEVHNHTGTTIWEFHASTTNRTDWEEDILDDGIISAGGRQRINLDDGTGRCRYDVRVTFKGGATLVKTNIDVCAVSIIDVYPSEIRTQ